MDAPGTIVDDGQSMCTRPSRLSMDGRLGDEGDDVVAAAAAADVGHSIQAIKRNSS